MSLSVNECFNPVVVIKLLRRLPLKQHNFALFLNFTLPKPEVMLVNNSSSIKILWLCSSSKMEICRRKKTNNSGNWPMKFTGFFSFSSLWGILRIGPQACLSDFQLVCSGLYLLRFASQTIQVLIIHYSFIFI